MPVADAGPGCLHDTDCLNDKACAFPAAASDGIPATPSSASLVCDYARGKCVTRSICNGFQPHTACGCDGKNVTWNGCDGLGIMAPAPVIAAEACGAQKPVTCVTNADCGSGEVCGFPVNGDCNAPSVCVPQSASCKKEGPFGCGCDGRPVALSCAGFPEGYAAAPVAELGMCGL
jgi:hypothetical protein